MSEQTLAEASNLRLRQVAMLMERQRISLDARHGGIANEQRMHDTLWLLYVESDEMAQRVKAIEEKLGL